MVVTEKTREKTGLLNDVLELCDTTEKSFLYMTTRRDVRMTRRDASMTRRM
jgi:hypothetical protein